MAVRLQRRQQDVDEPEAEEHKEGDELGCPWAPELPARHAGTPAVEQHQHAHQRHDGEDGDGEGQRARVHLEHLALGVPVNGRDGPRHADAQEDVHRVAARHVADGGVGVLVLDGGHFTRKRVCGGKREMNETPTTTQLPEQEYEGALNTYNTKSNIFKCHSGAQREDKCHGHVSTEAQKGQTNHWL